MKKFSRLVCLLLCGAIAASAGACADSGEKEYPVSVVYADFEQWAPDFQTIRMTPYAGVLHINEDKKYAKDNQSLLIRPMGQYTTGGKSTFIFPSYSEQFGFDYRDFNKTTSISFDFYNAEKQTKKVAVGLAPIISSTESFIYTNLSWQELAPDAWTTITYEVDTEELGKTYNLSSVAGFYVSFENSGSRKEEDAPEIYLDNIILNRITNDPSEAQGGKKNNTQSGSYEVSSGEAKYEVWSAPYTEKILQSAEINYDGYKSAPAVDLDMARAEIESAQIVITAETAIGYYDFEASDLTNTSGDVIKKEDVEVYSAQYVYISNLYDSARDFTKGYFPDTMMPIEKAVEYGENTIAKDCNQSIYVSVPAKWNQPAGTYTGTFTLKVNNDSIPVPVSVRVRDCMVSTEVTSKSCFGDTWTHYIGEYDSSQAMTDNYHKALMRYRLCPSWIINDRGYSESEIDYQCEKVVELYNYGSNEELFGKGADRFTNFTLPLGFDISGETMRTLVLQMLGKLAEVSCREGVDLVKRAYVYCVDEPEANNIFNIQKAVHEAFLIIREEAARQLESNREKYKSEYGVTDSFVDELVNSAANLHDLVTQSYMEKYDGYVDTWVPTFDSYDNPEAVKKYHEQNSERWWYGCIVPKSPYPTYHVSDILLSPRVLAWLQSYYDVTGNLYWAVDQWAGYHILPDEGRAYRFSDDYYAEAGPYDDVPGEGYLFRPGKKYGIDGPIATLRIDAIRDGLEEYEMMSEIKKIYAAAGLRENAEWNADAILTELIAPLASGMQINGTSESFATSRTTLLDLFELAQHGVCLVDYKDDGKGNVSYKLYIPDGASIAASVGKETDSQKLSSGTLKTFVVDMRTTEASNVSFDIKVGESTFVLEMALPGKVDVVYASELVNAFSGDLTENGVSVVNASDIVSGMSGQFVEFSLAAVNSYDSYGYQYIRLTDDLLKDINAQLSKVSFSFYWGGEDDLPFRLCVKYKDGRTIVEEYKGNLRYGINDIVWDNLDTKAWKNGEIEYIEFCFDDKNIGTELPARKVYFESLSLYKVAEDN